MGDRRESYGGVAWGSPGDGANEAAMSGWTSPRAPSCAALSAELSAGPAARRPPFLLTLTALLVVALGSCTADDQQGITGGAGNLAGSGIAYAPATGSGPPSRLQSLSATQVVALLGEPGFKREENPAQVWRYTGKACVLELFLYRLDKDFQVRHVETRDAKANAVAQDPCIAAIAAQKKTVAAK